MRIAILGVVLALIISVVGTYEYSKSAVVDELIADSRRGDAAAAAKRFDWVGLRAYMKQNLVESKKATQMFGDVGPPAAQISAIVDYFIQPENIDLAFYLHTKMFPGIKEEDFIDSVGYAFPYGFEVTLGVPKNFSSDDIPPALREKLKVRVVFRLDGLTWKVREMHVPLYMVPISISDVPAAKAFGRPATP